MLRDTVKQELLMATLVGVLYAICLGCLPYMVVRDCILSLRGKLRAKTR